MARTSTRTKHLATAAGAFALWLGGIWVASQGGFAAGAETAPGKFGAVIYLFTASLPKLLALWLGAIGLGVPLRKWLARDARHPIMLQVILGLGAMLMLDWLLAAVHLLNAWTAWGVCGLGTMVITYHFADPDTRESWHPDRWSSPPWTLMLALPALGLLTVACACPPGTLWAVEAYGYDVTSYHLEIPREWIELGGMTSLKHNVYSHLPLLSEAGYMKIALMHGSVFDAIYTIQFFHASVGLVAAIALSRFVSDYVGSAGSAMAGVILLTLPWTVITGSLPYNEMFVFAFGAGTMLALFDANATTWRGAAAIGLLLGLAVMAKLTSGGFLAIPVAVVMLARLHMPAARQPLPLAPGSARGMDNSALPSRGQPPAMDGTASDGTGGHDIVETRAAHTSNPPAEPGANGFALAAKMLAVTTFAATLIVAPYLVRNALWTGNPVFPFAARTLGQGHWSDDQVDRWNSAHHTNGVSAGLAALGRHWIFNAGYGAAAGGTAENESGEAARFDAEGGVPMLWIVVVAGAAAALCQPRLRRAAIALLLLLSAQLLFWLLATHQQSRFLIPTLLPACALAAIGFGLLEESARRHAKPWPLPLLASGLAILFTTRCFDVFLTQTPVHVTPQTRQRIRIAPWQIIDSLVDRADVTANQPGRFAGTHRLNQVLPAEDTRVLMSCDAMNVLYIRRPFVYSTAFDADPLGQIIRQQQGDPVRITIALSQAGFTHLWFNRGEFERLSAEGNYGVDPGLSLKKLDELLQLWFPQPPLPAGAPPRPRLIDQPVVLVPVPRLVKAMTENEPAPLKP